MPLISFIITDYNLPVALLKECIESILATDLKPEEREIILVDDGSDVSPWEELADYHDAITYVRQENKGLSVARNLGLDRALGKFIQFVDGDDCLIKSGYNIIVDKLRKPDTYFDTEIIMFRSSRKATNRRNFAALIKLFWYTSSKEYLTKKNLRGAAWGYVFRREIAGDLRFTPNIYHEDEEFTPRLILRSAYVLFTSIRAYYYRARENSIILDTSEELIQQRLRDFADIILRLRHLSLVGSTTLTRRVHQLTMDYLYNAIKKAKDYEGFCHYIEVLRVNHLIPLALRPYTAKYFLFALLSRGAWGRKMLYKLLS